MAAVVYDVPPVYTAHEVLNILRQTMDTRRVTQLCWTPGEPALAARKIVGQGVDAMDGLLLTDAAGETWMAVLGYCKCAARRREQKEAQARSREERSRPPPQKRQTTYVVMARKPATSLLGPQHGPVGGGKGKGSGKGKGM